jgi:glycosyltransferase involved in cell wall biosynthesis
VILLLEPPCRPGFVSGGYRYQRAIGERLAASGSGELRTVAPEQLASTAAAGLARGDIVVVDGLFLADVALPSGAFALLHMPAPPHVPLAARQVIATGVGTAAATALEGASVLVVRPGLDACFRPSAAPRRPGPRRVVCVGTLSPHKGQLELAAAIDGLGRPCAASAENPRVPRGFLDSAARRASATSAPGAGAPWPSAADSPRCELTLVGATDAKVVAALRRHTGSMQLRLVGVLPVAAVAAELHQADLLVSASRSESFGMAVAEAAAVGIPVLAFATGEIATFVVDGENGWLLPADAPWSAFVDRLRTLLAIPTHLEAARQAAKRPALADWDATARTFVAACERLAAGGMPSGQWALA